MLKATEAMGFREASAIQAQAIPVLLNGEDIIAQAETGTGKTAAFAIPAIEKLDLSSNETQILVLCPTRELVVQVAGEFHKLTKFHKGASVLAIYGGQSIGIQFKILRRGAQIVVGTPGRIMDHLRRKTLKLNNLSYMVLDEADQMLNMGFRDDIDTILKQTPSSRQTLMFSATMPQALVKLMEKHQKNPQRISTVNTEKQSKQINQFYFNVSGKNKFESLTKLIEFYNIKSALIFCNTKIKVDDLSDSLNAKDFSSAGLHGDMKQNKRDRAMQSFRRGNVQFLVATDVAARGIDVSDLEAVINYDLPKFDEDYIHRIGRTGRAGKAGLALTLVSGRETEHIRRIARKNNLNISISEISGPDTQETKPRAFEGNRRFENRNFESKRFENKRFSGKKFENKKFKTRKFVEEKSSAWKARDLVLA